MSEGVTEKGSVSPEWIGQDVHIEGWQGNPSAEFKARTE